MNDTPTWPLVDEEETLPPFPLDSKRASPAE